MRRLIPWGALLLASLAGSPVAQATIAKVQACSNAAQTTTDPSCSTGANVTSGNLIVVVGYTQNNNPANLGAVTGTGGCNGTYTSRTSNYTDPVGVAFWTSPVASTSTCTVTWSKAATSEPAGIVVYELSGWDGTTPTDGAAVFNTTALTGNGALTVTMTGTSVAADFLIGAILSTDVVNITYTTPQSGFANDVALTTAGIFSETETRITSSPGTYTAGWSTITQGTSNSRTYNLGALAIRGVATTPTINSTTPAPNVSNGASLTINGVNLKAAGNSTVTFGGASQTVTSQSSTAPVITAARSTNKYGVGLNLILTDSTSAASNTFSTTGIIPQAGWNFVNLGSLVASGNRITAISDLVSGDQVAYDTKVGLVTVFADGSFVADPSVASFSVEAWTASAWGTVATQSINASVGLNANGGWFMFTR